MCVEGFVDDEWEKEVSTWWDISRGYELLGDGLVMIIVVGDSTVGTTYTLLLLITPNNRVTNKISEETTKYKIT